MNRHIIKNSERGHRPLLSPSEVTKCKSIKLQRTLFDYVDTMGGSKFVRELIEREYGKTRR